VRSARIIPHIMRERRKPCKHRRADEPTWSCTRSVSDRSDRSNTASRHLLSSLPPERRSIDRDLRLPSRQRWGRNLVGRTGHRRASGNGETPAAGYLPKTKSVCGRIPRKSLSVYPCCRYRRMPPSAPRIPDALAGSNIPSAYQPRFGLSCRNSIRRQMISVKRLLQSVEILRRGSWKKE